MLAPGSSRARVAVVAAGLIVAIVAAYHNSLSVPFVFDDPRAITENPTIRRLWPLAEVLLPPRGEGLTVEGRPVLNLTLAVNYAFGGTAVRGYHAFNIALHALVALTLFGLVRRTLLLPHLRARFGAGALPIAAATALLWALHPLHTAAITYVVQRAEALVALFYLLTLYSFVRAVGQVSDLPISGSEGGSQTRPTFWPALAVFSCLVGMATKEVMVSAPLLVLLYDRIFVAASWREAWRQRRRLHAALFSTWLLLGALVLSTGTRGGTAGFGIDVSPLQYALTQFEAVTRYVGLCFWPHPLIFDYGVAWVERAVDVLPHACVLFALIAGTIVAWRRWPAVAWLGILVFAVLSPTSSIVPGNRQTMAEHRMYLPSAAVITLVVCGVHVTTHGSRHARVFFAGAVAAASALGVLTVRRNVDYRSEIALYRDTANKRPANGFARYNLGKAYADAAQHPAALREYKAALELMPDSPGIHYNLANSLAELGQLGAARAHYESAVRIDPRYARALFNLGNLLLREGDTLAAARHFRAALTSEPRNLEARVNLAGALLELGGLDEARMEFTHVLRERPDSAEAHFGLANVFMLQERWAEAAREFEAVLRLRPDLAIARERLELARSRSK